MAKIGANFKSLHSEHVISYRIDETTFGYAKGDSLAFHFKIPAAQSSQACRQDTKGYFGYTMSEGSQGPTNQMIRLSVLEFLKHGPASLAPTVIMMLLMMEKAHVLKLKASASCIPQSKQDGRLS